MHNRLKEFRELKGMTQAEVATAAGIPFRTYQDYELGTRKAPSVYAALKIAKAFSIAVDELFPIGT